MGTLMEDLQAAIVTATGKTNTFNGSLHDLCDLYNVPAAQLPGRLIPVAATFDSSITGGTSALNYLLANPQNAAGPYALFANGEVGAWYDPSDFLPNWRVNLLTYTQDFSNSSWLTNGNLTKGSAQTDPFGGTTALRIIASAANGDIYKSFSSSNVTHTSSLWMRRVSGTGDISFNTPGNVQNNVTLTSQWQRFTVSGLPAGGTDVYFAIRIVTAGDSIDIAFAQSEVGSTATTYQPIVTPEVSYLTYQPLPVMYQDSAGTTPVTAVEQPVGLVLDKSKGLVLGAELVTNGDFSGGTTAWTAGTTVGTRASISAASGGLQVTATDNFGRAYQAITTVAGQWYQVTVDARVTSGAGTCFVEANTAIVSGTSLANTSAVAASATQTCRFLATGTTTYILLLVSTATSVALFDNVTVKQLPGNHAFQSTAASRPVLSARVNLLTYTEQFDNAYWTKLNATITANATTAPDGTTTADLVTANATAEIRVGIESIVAANTTYTASISAKFGNANGRYLWYRDFFANKDTAFDLQNGVVVSAPAGVTATITAEANGFYRCTVTLTEPAAAVVVNQQYWVQSASSSNVSGGVSGGQFYIWGADLRVANEAAGIPAYQRVNTATDYNTVNFPLYLKFDGVDDSLATNSINFSATDKMTVWAGVRKLSDAAAGMVAELSASRSVNAGAFSLIAPSTAAAANYVYLQRGSVDPANTPATTFAAPITNVLTGFGDIAADLCKLRVNSVAFDTSTGDQGTGTFGNYPLYIGRRGGTTLPYNGRLYSLIIRGAASSAAQISAAEAWVNTKTKAWA